MLRNRFFVRVLIGFALFVFALGSFQRADWTPRVFADPPPLPPAPRQLPPPGTESIGYPVPRTGDQKLLVVLADFSDRAGLFTGQQWQSNFLDANGFKDYFAQVSYNQLRYTGDIVGKSGSTPVVNSSSIAYVRLPKPITYYANGQYGFGGTFPNNNSGVVYHTLQALDQASFNFAPYADASKRVQNLIVIFAGSTHRYTNNANNSLEATAYRLTWSKGSPFTSGGGYIFDNYTFCPDQRGNLTGEIAILGVCAHEHGHALGMYDLYDFSYTTAGLGDYDIMGSGTWGNTQGVRPFHFGAYSKQMFGWTNPTVPAPGTSTVQLGPAESGANFIRLYPNGNLNSKEYFLLENRQGTGFDQDWTAKGLCKGLLIWHIDQNIIDQHPYAVNTLSSAGGGAHQGILLVEADGTFDMIHSLNYGECNDTWTVGRTWNNTSTPNSRLWNGSASGLSVRVSGETNGVLTLDITTPTQCASAPLKPILVSPVGGAAVTTPKAPLDWKDATCATTYNVLVKQDSKTGATVWSKNGAPNSQATTKKLLKGKTYFWRVEACNPPHGCTKSGWGKFKLN